MNKKMLWALIVLLSVYGVTAASIGEQKTLVILANFNDATNLLSIDQVKNMMFNASNSVEASSNPMVCASILAASSFSNRALY